jgi:hypothetical protein
MSKNIIFVLMWHGHKLLDLMECLNSYSASEESIHILGILKVHCLVHKSSSPF